MAMFSQKSKLTAVVLAAAGLVMGASAPAWAHAKLLSSVPAADGVVPAGPVDVALTFSEAVTVISCKAVDNTGKDVPDTTQVEGKVLHIVFANPLTPGTYSVGYRIAGPDTHPVQGAFNFRVEAAKR